MFEKDDVIETNWILVHFQAANRNSTSGSQSFGGRYPPRHSVKWSNDPHDHFLKKNRISMQLQTIRWCVGWIGQFTPGGNLPQDWETKCRHRSSQSFGVVTHLITC